MAEAILVDMVQLNDKISLTHRGDGSVILGVVATISKNLVGSVNEITFKNSCLPALSWEELQAFDIALILRQPEFVTGWEYRGNELTNVPLGTHIHNKASGAKWVRMRNKKGFNVWVCPSDTSLTHEAFSDRNRSWYRIDYLPGK